MPKPLSIPAKYCVRVVNKVTGDIMSEHFFNNSDSYNTKIAKLGRTKLHNQRIDGLIKQDFAA